MKKSALIAILLLPAFAHAAKYAPFEVSGWIPYWRAATGTDQALLYLDNFREINPFTYSVKSDGTLSDLGGMSSEPWASFLAMVRQKEIRVIPTVMWSDGQNIHRILSDSALRSAHIQAIKNMVFQGGFDGVDIDYEAKLALTNPYFSLFLKELYGALGTTKWVMCTIEPRTPLDSRNASAPNATPQYANDYAELNKYCDRVRIMAYDQGSVDKKLTSAAEGPYIPVADVRWVEKVIREAMQTISKNKIMIGIPTYGYEYKVLPLTSGYKYQRITAFNPKYATDIVEKLGIEPLRNSAGELSLVYTDPSDAISGGGASFNIYWWSDAKAIEAKLKLARRLGVRGVSIFKIDGGADPAIWPILSKYK